MRWKAVAVLLGLTWLGGAEASAQNLKPPPDLFEIPPFHSQVEFAVPFMGLATVKGNFEDFAGVLALNEKDLKESSVTVTIQATSLHTGNALRDKHLRSADFLDVEKFPVLIFQSKRIETTGEDGFRAIGPLTIRGVTQNISLPFKVRHPVVRDTSGVDYAGFDAEIKLNWRDFGIPGTNRNNSWFQPTKMLVSDSVTVSLSIEADRRHPSRLHYPGLDDALAMIEKSGVRAYLQNYFRLQSQKPDSAELVSRPMPDVGRALIEKGRVQEAIDVLRVAVEASNNSSDAFANLGQAYLAAGDNAGASKAFREALRVDPNNPHALEMIRRMYP